MIVYKQKKKKKLPILYLIFLTDHHFYIKNWKLQFAIF